MAAEPSLEQLLQQLRINVPEPTPMSNFIGTDNGLAGIYVFDIKAGTIVYRYDVDIIDLKREKSLTKGGSDDGKKWLLRTICYELVNTTFKNMNGGKVQFVYDNRTILYTNEQIREMLVQIEPEQMSKFCRDSLHDASVTVELKPCKTYAHVLSVSDLSTALQRSPHEQADRSLRTFLEMLTSQAQINAGSHKIVGAGRLFETREARRVTDAITTHNGIAKGVRIIANGGTRPAAALVADVKTCAFFASGNLEQIANAMMQKRRNLHDPKVVENFWSDFGQLYKGVSATLTYAPWRVIVIDSITNRNCAQISFEVEGREVSMVDFFNNQKKVRINPNMPAVRQHVDRDSLYPLACLQILPFQRLPLDKMQLNEEMQQISSNLLKANAVFPKQRHDAIEEEVRKIGQDGANFMAQFGVHLKGSRNDVQIGRFPLPPIEFANKFTQQQDDKGRFDVRGNVPMRYMETSNKVKSWVVAHPRKIERSQYSNFLNNLMRMANQRGMQLPPQPKEELVEFNQIDERMKQFHEQKVQFVLYIDNKFVKSHTSLKLCEKRYNVLTQHVTIENAEKAGPATVSNVLGKMNMKLFGLNYLPAPIIHPAPNTKLNLASVLVIGLDTSRPPRATAFEKFQLRKNGLDVDSEDPMVVGIASNILPNQFKFVGDYYFQPCKQDVLNGEELITKVKWLLHEAKAARAEAKLPPPSTIFIIRDGVSEGMVPNLLAPNCEFDAFKEACRQFAPQWKPKFVFCVVDKRHNKRFFVKAGNNIQNTMPGSVIDRKFVRVDMHEFFLQSHFPLKGCSKIPQYIIPVNDVNASNLELQQFIHQLCNMWQIVNLAPALPAPVLQAKELAKRGRNNYMELKRNNPQQIPHHPAQGRLAAVDVTKLNQMLSYEKVMLVKTRFNA